VLFAVVFTVLPVSLASAQQVDIAAGIGTLLSPATTSDSVTLLQPAEKGGTYLNVSGDVVGGQRRLGLQFETAWRYHKGSYPSNGETYRPFLSDLNLLYQPRVGIRKVGIDLMGGVGIASTRFYGPIVNSCTNPVIGCINYTGSNHFMEDLGAGVRYYFWRHFFVRPEIRYYHIQNNREFNSSNVFRVGASLGFTLHPN